jgi:hypothetical protein
MHLMLTKPLRIAIAFTLPVLLVFAFSFAHPKGYWFLAAAPLCGIAGGLALGKRWSLSIVLGLCFGIIGLMFLLSDARSPWFSDIIWTGLVSGFLFWVAGGSAVLTLPPQKRFDAAAALAVPGTIAGMVFQFFYGPAHFLFDLSSRSWWGDAPWEHLLLWLIVSAGGGYALALKGQANANPRIPWAVTSIACAIVGSLIGAAFFLRSKLPLGLFNSLSPASVAADWLWGWGVLATAVALVALFKPNRKLWASAGMVLAVIVIVTSYRVEANPWKSQFNSKYAEKLLRENAGSGDAIYTGNLILAQAALDNNDVANAKRFLLEAATTSGARRIEQNGLDTSVARVLFDRGEKDAVVEYLHRGRQLWPQGAQLISRWENAIKAGRRPNFNTRGPGGGGQGNPQDR